MSQPKVSIIIPVYNASSTLLRCVDSVIHQSYTDIEILLVNDGSTDNSASLCNELVSQDSRIKVLHKCNGGVSSARNSGLNHATGEWITFVDSDDWLELEFLSNLIVYSEDYSLIVAGFKRLGDKVDESKPDISCAINIVDELHVLWGKTLDKFIFWYVWGKLFRLDIIKLNNITFHEEMKYSEDNCFLLEYMSCVNSFMYVAASDYIHLFESGRSQKYSMDIDIFRRHIEKQERSFEKLESKTGHRYALVRQNVHRRFFDCFIYYLLNQANYISYCSELNRFKKLDADGVFLNEVSYSFNRHLLRLALFQLPCPFGYIFRRLFLWLAY
ncbi:glycosyltransferase family 2 protein [Phocaeicola sp.]